MGEAIPSLCHPFAATKQASKELEGRAKAVVFHNGTWPSWRFKIESHALQKISKVPGGPFNDSRTLAWLAGLYGPNIFNVMDVDHQRILYFSTDKVLHWGSWAKGDGYIHSAPSYTSSSYSRGVNIQDDKDWEKDRVKFDPKEKALVPIHRRPTELLDVRVITPSGGTNLSEDTVGTEWTRAFVAEMVFRCRRWNAQAGYLHAEMKSTVCT